MIANKMKELSHYLFGLLCICGLVYQSLNLYSDYMSGNTVVNIKVDRIIDETIPVCFDTYASLERVSQLSQISPLLANLLQNYTYELNLFFKNNNTHIGSIKSEHYYKLLQIELTKLHGNMTVWEFFEKITINFCKGFLKQLITVTLNGHPIIKKNNSDFVRLGDIFDIQ